MKRAAWYLVLTLVILFMAVAVFIYVAPHINWHVNAVLTGSMEPELTVGSLVITSPIEPENVVVGDIITFRPVSVGENMITHRVISIGRSSSVYFETKGDANDRADPFTVPAQNLIGKVSWHAPYWGYFTEFLKTPIGFLFAIVIPGVVIITSYILAVLRALGERGKVNQ
ncbi:signal peptidase I [Chloroflexota bacterium]